MRFTSKVSKLIILINARVQDLDEKKKIFEGKTVPKF